MASIRSQSINAVDGLTIISGSNRMVNISQDSARAYFAAHGEASTIQWIKTQINTALGDSLLSSECSVTLGPDGSITNISSWSA